MNRVTASLLKAVLVVAPLLASTAQAQVVVSVGVYPPAAYVATYQPEYFEGRPVYFYNNSWYYRDHGRWSYYRAEPRYLRDRRAHWGERGRVIERGRVERGREVERGRGDGRYHYRR